MAKTPSQMPELGRKATSIELPDGLGLQHIWQPTQHKPLLIMFICNHCPFVIHIISELSKIGNKLLKEGCDVIAINSNDIAKYPDDHPDKMVLFARKYDFAFPYLFDQTQTVAKTYQAACTPDFFLYDHSHKLVYRGQFDDSRPGSEKPVNGADLLKAWDYLKKGKTIPNHEQRPSLGCNIKWLN